MKNQVRFRVSRWWWCLRASVCDDWPNAVVIVRKFEHIWQSAKVNRTRGWMGGGGVRVYGSCQQAAGEKWAEPTTENNSLLSDKAIRSKMGFCIWNTVAVTSWQSHSQLGYNSSKGGGATGRVGASLFTQKGFQTRSLSSDNDRQGIEGRLWVSGGWGAWHSLNWPTSAAYALVQRVVHRMSGCAGCRMPDWGFVKEKLHFHAFGAAWASVEPHTRRRMCWELKRCKMRVARWERCGRCTRLPRIKKEKFASLRWKFSYLFASSNFWDWQRYVHVCGSVCIRVCVSQFLYRRKCDVP